MTHTNTWSASTLPQRIAWMICCVLLLVSSSTITQTTLLKDQYSPFDFGPYFISGIQALSGEPIGTLYAKEAVRTQFARYWTEQEETETPPRIAGRFIYPPLFGYLMIPFTLGSYEEGRYAWGWFLYAGFLLLGIALVSLLPARLRPYGAVLYLLYLLFSTSVHRNIGIGQINVFATVGALLGYILYIRDQLWKGSVSLGLSVFVKILPVVTGLYLLAARAWKMIGVGLSIGIILLITSFLVAGIDSHSAFINWAAPFITSTEKFDTTRQNCPSFACYLSRALPSSSVASAIRDRIASITQIVVLLGLTSGLAFSKRSPLKRGKSLRVRLQDAVAFSLFLSLPVLFSGSSQDHYLVYTFPVQFLLLHLLFWNLWTSWNSDRSLKSIDILCTLVTTVAVVILNVPQWNMDWASSGPWTLFYSPWFIALCVLHSVAIASVFRRSSSLSNTQP